MAMSRDPDDSPGTQVLSASALGLEPANKSGGEACLILLHPPGPDIGRRFRLDLKYYSVGRGSDSDLMVPRDAVSRKHAELICDDDGKWSVEDQGSTNGTFINEIRSKQHDLRDGDQIRFGDAIYKFLIGENVENAYHEEIYRMTIMDGLTGVHNKRYFLEFLERELASAQRHKHPLAMVLFDIDHFKQINDEKGHLCGDEVLKQLCARLRPRMRREDLLARYGGEEFACILTITTLEGGVTFAEALRDLICKEPFEFEGDRFTVTVSAGVACANGGEESTGEQLVSQADQNLYRAKNAGRNQVVPNPSDLTIPG